MSDNRLLIIGPASENLINVVIVDLSKGSLIDSFYAFAPTLSPNRRWLAFRRFYPLHPGETIFSEQYMIYDTQKNRDENETIDPNGAAVAGKPIYPIGKLFQNANLPDTERHSIASDGFFWDADSKVVVLGDLGYDGFSLVAVFVGERAPVTYVHPVAMRDVCGSSFNDRPSLTLASAMPVYVGEDNFRVQAEFRKHGECEPAILSLSRTDFVPAKLEQHAPIEPPLGPMIKVEKPASLPMPVTPLTP